LVNTRAVTSSISSPEHRGLTQEGLARASKVSRPMIAAIEARHKKGGTETLKKLAGAL
jgi:transcriptional regulator with XRE-family HTH domain